jgi:hypothetical protein
LAADIEALDLRFRSGIDPQKLTGSSCVDESRPESFARSCRPRQGGFVMSRGAWVAVSIFVSALLTLTCVAYQFGVFASSRDLDRDAHSAPELRGTSSYVGLLELLR